VACGASCHCSNDSGLIPAIYPSSHAKEESSDAGACRLIPRAAIAAAIRRIIKERGLTQTETAYLVKDAPSQVSLIVTGKLAGFSSERLLRVLARLGHDIEIRTSPAKGKTGKVRLKVG
jgi:predicted XRE-type DNA-binding protein